MANVIRPSAEVRKILREARIARLATVDLRRRPYAVPICFVYRNGMLYSPIDRKPKSRAPEQLARVRNIRAVSRVAVLIDHYEENWGKLWFLLIHGTAKVLDESERAEHDAAFRALSLKYRQYAGGMLTKDAPVIQIAPERFKLWRAGK